MLGRGDGDGEERERRDIVTSRGQREAEKNVLINATRPGKSQTRISTTTAMQASLRSKSTVRTGPRPAAKLNKPNKNARKSKVDDKIKRRMSARYATISAPTPTDAVPSVPTISLDIRGTGLVPIREKDENSQVQTPTKEDLRAAENRLLDVEEFDPDACACFFIVSSARRAQHFLRPQVKTRQFNRS